MRKRETGTEAEGDDGMGGRVHGLFSELSTDVMEVVVVNAVDMAEALEVKFESVAV